MPRVSVIMPSYNHEKYVAEAVQSVLDQDYDDFELVITDDGSTDGTVDVIKGFSDPRVKLFVFEENRGAGPAARKCLDEARGEYVAVLSSDDAFLPGKLERQVRFLDEHPGVAAAFGYAKIIGEEGEEFEDEDHFYYNIFRQPNRTRHEWLRRFFFKGNCLCHPSALIRRKLYDEIGYYDERYHQLPDFDFWVRTCLRHDIHVLPEELIKFRVRAGEANVSGSRPEVHKRSHYEMSRIFRHYLEIDSPEDLLKVFPEAAEYGEVKKELIPYFVARVAIDHATTHPLHEMLGLDILFDLLGDGKTAERLEREYGFRHRDFIKLTGEHDVFNLEAFWFQEKLKQELERQMKNELEQKGLMLAEKERQLEDILNSASWKVTAPLRFVGGLGKKKRDREE